MGRKRSTELAFVGAPLGPLGFTEAQRFRV